MRTSLFASRTAASWKSIQSCVENAAEVGSGAGCSGSSALPGLKAPMRLVDDIDASLAPHDAIVAVAATQRFQ
jgi:hypothetical protein